MKYIDKTPYRSEDGKISLLNRVQGMLKYGLSWYDRVKAQDMIAATLDRQLSGQFVLLQNILLPNTDIVLPLVLLGPPGLFLINALHERGVYMARDDEWGTLSGDTFTPADINQVKRSMTMAKVLGVYLERLGHRNVDIEPIILSADPGLHIDSTRPQVRIVMSDAIDRFALSLMQASPVLNLPQIAELEQVILTGKSRRSAAPNEAQAAPSAAEGGVFLPEADDEGGLSFTFDEQLEAAETDAEGQPFATAEMPAPSPPAKARKQKKKKIMGMTQVQLGIVIALLLCWLCGLLAFAAYYAYFIGWIQFA